jgi:hypothetical protein
MYRGGASCEPPPLVPESVPVRLRRERRYVLREWCSAESHFPSQRRTCAICSSPRETNQPACVADGCRSCLSCDTVPSRGQYDKRLTATRPSPTSCRAAIPPPICRAMHSHAHLCYRERLPPWRICNLLHYRGANSVNAVYRGREEDLQGVIHQSCRFATPRGPASAVPGLVYAGSTMVAPEHVLLGLLREEPPAQTQE